MDIIVIGDIGDKRIAEPIRQFQPHIDEQLATAKKNIRHRFEVQGYNPDDVIFETKELLPYC